MRNITHVQLGLAVASMNFRDSESFILKQSLGAAAVWPDGLRAARTVTEPNLADCFRASRMRMAPVMMELAEEIRRAFISGCFDACTKDASFRTAWVGENEQHVFLPEIIPQRLLGAVIRKSDCL